MTMHKTLLCVCTIALLAVALVFGRHASVRVATRPQAKGMPEHVVYSHLFRHVMLLKAKAAEAERGGKDGQELRTLYKNNASLNNSQANALDEVAADCERQISEVDAKAKETINRLKQLYPGGKIPDGEHLPPPPPELKTLWDQRTQIILNARDRLRSAYGEQEFVRFDHFVKQTTKIQVEPPLLEKRFHPPPPQIPESLTGP